MKVGLIVYKCFITYPNSVSVLISFLFPSWIINEFEMVGYEVDAFKCGVRPYTISRSKWVYLYMLNIISIMILCDNRYNDMRVTQQLSILILYVHSGHIYIHIHYIQIRHVHIHKCWSVKCWQAFTILVSTG